MRPAFTHPVRALSAALNAFWRPIFQRGIALAHDGLDRVGGGDPHVKKDLHVLLDRVGKELGIRD